MIGVVGYLLLAVDAATAAAVLVLTVCVGILAVIVGVLATDRHDHVVRVVGVAPRPAAPLPRPAGPPDPPLTNPRFAAHIAQASAQFTAALRSGVPR